MAEGYNAKPRLRSSRSRTESSSTDFTKKFDGSDVIFMVEGKDIHAAKSVLMLASPNFRTMFRGTQDGDKIIIDDIRYSDFYRLMESLHPVEGRQLNLDEEKIYQLLPLIKHFEINGMLKQCEECLLEHKPQLRHLAIANEFQFKNLEKKTISWASKASLTKLRENPDWGIVEDSYRTEILERIISKYEGNDQISELETKTKSLQTRNNKLTERCDQYTKIVDKIRNITEGNIHKIGGSLQPCNSMVHTKHHKGSMPNCVNCRSEMIVLIKRTLQK